MSSDESTVRSPEGLSALARTTRTAERSPRRARADSRRAGVPHETWWVENQRHLVAALAELREAIQRRLAPETEIELPSADPAAIAARMAAPPAIHRLASLFELSRFERDVLLLMAAPQLDSAFGELLKRIQGSESLPPVTFSLALAALPDGHWSATSPSGALRRHGLATLGEGENLLTSPLRLPQQVLFYLTGIEVVEPSLHGVIAAVEPAGALPSPSQAGVIDEIVRFLAAEDTPPLPIVQLDGLEPHALRPIASMVCDRLGLTPFQAHADDLALHGEARADFVRTWNLGARLWDRALLVHLGPGAPASSEPASRLLDECEGVVFALGDGSLRTLRRPAARFTAPPPAADEQRALWSAVVPDLDEDTLDRLSTHFRMGARDVQQLVRKVRGAITEAGSIADELWDAARAQLRVQVDGLATRVEPRATWDDLVLPQASTAVLEDVVAHSRYQTRVYRDWGFAEKCERGLGLCALFEGGSGTGKTLAAEVLANELKLDLYRVDLSLVVSKYIGETEKNLRRLFDDVERAGAVLLFDEADALFGKRSEVKDSHDRHANIEVSYLLQRIEAYRGLAILTTNLASALDPAFRRRIRFIVTFPFPDVSLRERIWQRVFPEKTPTRELDTTKLAKLNATGASIRNIALDAAFLAARKDEPVGMDHLLQAAKRECAKQKKPISPQEVEGWVS